MATWVIKWTGANDDCAYYGGPDGDDAWTDREGAYRYQSLADVRAENKRFGGFAMVLRRGSRKGYQRSNGLELVPCHIAVEVIARALNKAFDECASDKAMGILHEDLAHWLAKVDEQRAAL
jgi:hypothetical protein